MNKTEAKPSVRSRVDQYVDRIKRHNEDCNAIWTPNFDAARSQADTADKHAHPGRLHGMVVALKDNIDTANLRTTSGSKLFEAYVPTEDARVWRLMHDAGAILIGKAGLHECVFGANSQNEWFGRIRNPWSLAHIPGGSSGGSGAAVAADFCDLALGTDTGGSVRIPSAMCGIAGLRPTMGAVSNRGVRPISPHLDTVGPMARRVQDIAAAFAVMRAYDPLDETSVPPPDDVTDANPKINTLTIGLAKGFFAQQLHPRVESALERTVAILRELGVNIVPVTIPESDKAAQITARIIVADAADYYRHDIENRRDAFSDQLMRRLSLGFDVTGIEYANAMRFMYRWQRQIDQVFDDVDLVLSPTLRAPAPLIDDSDDLIKVTETITPFTMAWALSGAPTLAIPCGFSADGLPVSCQLAARRWHENTLFAAGMAFQDATDFHTRHAPLR